MEFIEEIDPKEYDNFVSKHKKNHFLQSYSWGEFAKKEKKLIPHYVGLKDNKKILAATLLLEKRLPMGLCYMYAPRGYIIDYSDETLLKQFTEYLKQFAKKSKAIYVKIDPDITLHNLNSHGDVLEDTKNNEALINKLELLGYKHLGFNKNFENNQPRYTFRLSLKPTIEEITNNFHPTTKKIINKGNTYDLNIVKNDFESIQDFFETMCQTAQREGIVNHNFEYYKNYYELLHKNNMSDLYVVTAEVNKLKELYKEKIKQIENEMAKLSEPKYKSTEKNNNKKREFINQLTKAEKEYNIIKEIKKERIVLSSILTAKFGNKVWTLYGGNNTLLRELNANYLIYYEIIKDAKKEKYEIIDFFGTTGNPTKENPVYGIHLFKKRLGGDYIEFLGEFDLVTKPLLYFCFTKLVPFYRKLVRAISKKRNNRKN